MTTWRARRTTTTAWPSSRRSSRLRARDGRAALAAAKRVNLEQDSDLQDLYVLSMALDLGGDHGAARFARDHICAGKDYLMKPLLLLQLAREGNAVCPAGGPQ